VSSDEDLDFYRIWSEAERTLPLFSKGWWLDAVAPGRWGVSVVKKEDNIVASMPYVRGGTVLRVITGPRILGQPPFTQNLGPWISASAKTTSRGLSRQKFLMETLIDQLPSYSYFRQNWHYDQTNWLPFFWRGFRQTTRYTYVIDDLSDIAATLSRFDHSKRKDIRKARQIVTVSWDLSAEDFFQNHESTLGEQGKRISYDFKTFERIYNAAYLRKKGRTLGAYDAMGNLHAALFIVFDDMSAYNLVSTIDPRFRSSGAASLLVQEAITLSAKLGFAKFDFEGSMIEGVENSFRKFGASQFQYHSLVHVPSRLIRLALASRDMTRL